MTDTIGRIRVPAVVLSTGGVGLSGTQVFPLTTQYPFGFSVDYPVITHRFGSLDAKQEPGILGSDAGAVDGVHVYGAERGWDLEPGAGDVRAGATLVSTNGECRGDRAEPGRSHAAPGVSGGALQPTEKDDDGLYIGGFVHLAADHYLAIDRVHVQRIADLLLREPLAHSYQRIGVAPDVSAVRAMARAAIGAEGCFARLPDRNEALQFGAIQGTPGFNPSDHTRLVDQRRRGWALVEKHERVQRCESPARIAPIRGRDLARGSEQDDVLLLLVGGEFDGFAGHVPYGKIGRFLSRGHPEVRRKSAGQDDAENT